MASALARVLGVGLRRASVSRSVEVSSALNTGILTKAAGSPTLIAATKCNVGLAYNSSTAQMSSLNVKRGLLRSSANIPSGQFLGRSSLLVPNRLYSSLIAGGKQSIGKSKPYVCQRRLISCKTILEAAKTQSVKLLKESVLWAKENVLFVILVMKSVVLYQVEVLKKGFRDKAVSLNFSALMFIGYAQFSRMIDSSETRLLQLDMAEVGDDGGSSKLTWRAIRMALFCISFIKVALMVFSSGEVEEMRKDVNHLKSEVSGFLKRTSELNRDNLKLREELNLLKLDNLELMEEVKLLQSDTLERKEGSSEGGQQAASGTGSGGSEGNSARTAP